MVEIVIDITIWKKMLDKYFFPVEESGKNQREKKFMLIYLQPRKKNLIISRHFPFDVANK